MDIIKDLFEEVWVQRVFSSILTIIISLIIYLILTHTIIKKIEHGNSKLFSNKKTKTYIRLLRSVIRYLFIILTIFVLLQINGVNITSMIAGVGIFGIIFGFAIQDALKDIIKGFDIISDSYYQVGDVIKYKDVTGKVLSVGLKTTKVQDVYTLNIVSISNRNIDQVEVLSNLININIPIPFDLKVSYAEEVMNEVVNNLKTINNIDKAEYRGINDIGESSLLYQVKVYCDPINKVQIRRDALGCIIKTLENNNIRIPYKQIDIHSK